MSEDELSDSCTVMTMSLLEPQEQSPTGPSRESLRAAEAATDISENQEEPQEGSPAGPGREAPRVEEVATDILEDQVDPQERSPTGPSREALRAVEGATDTFENEVEPQEISPTGPRRGAVRVVEAPTDIFENQEEIDNLREHMRPEEEPSFEYLAKHLYKKRRDQTDLEDNARLRLELAEKSAESYSDRQDSSPHPASLKNHFRAVMAAEEAAILLPTFRPDLFGTFSRSFQKKAFLRCLKMTDKLPPRHQELAAKLREVAQMDWEICESLWEDLKLLYNRRIDYLKSKARPELQKQWGRMLAILQGETSSFDEALEVPQGGGLDCILPGLAPMYGTLHTLERCVDEQEGSILRSGPELVAGQQAAPASQEDAKGAEADNARPTTKGFDTEAVYKDLSADERDLVDGYVVRHLLLRFFVVPPGNGTPPEDGSGSEGGEGSEGSLYEDRAIDSLDSPEPRRRNRRSKAARQVADEVAARERKAAKQMEALIREEEEQREAKQRRRQKAQAKKKQRAQLLDAKRLQKGAETPEEPSPAASEAAQSVDVAQIEEDQSLQKALEEEQLERERRQEELANARKAKERARKAAKKQRRLARPAASQRTTPEDPAPSSASGMTEMLPARSGACGQSERHRIRPHEPERLLNPFSLESQPDASLDAHLAGMCGELDPGTLEQSLASFSNTAEAGSTSTDTLYGGVMSDASTVMRPRPVQASYRASPQASVCMPESPEVKQQASPQLGNGERPSAWNGLLSPAECEEDIPELFCPLTLELMEDPAILSDGITYERAAIEEWLEKSNTSPNTNLVLTDKRLLPNRALKGLCSRYRAWKEATSSI